MALVYMPKTYITGNENIAIAAKDLLVAAGWTLVYDNSPAFVLSSRGETGTNLPVYWHIVCPAAVAYVQFLPCRGWNPATNARLQQWHYSTINRLATTGYATQTYMIGVANKDGAFIIAYTGTYWYFQGLALVDPWEIDYAVGTLQSDVTAGADKVIQLALGEANNFVAGKTYVITDRVSREVVTVSAVDTVNHTVTATLAYAFNIADIAMIGTRPDRWANICAPSTSIQTVTPDHTTSGTGNFTTVAGVAIDLVTAALMAPDAHSGKFLLCPVGIPHGTTGFFGVVTKDAPIRKARISTTSEHTMGAGSITTGTSTGSNGAATLIDTGAAWTIDAYIDKVIIITAGLGAGQFRKIASNTATQVTVTANWTTVPDATSGYDICEQGWLYMAFRNSNTNAMAFRAA